MTVLDPVFVAEFTVNHLGNLNLLFRMVDEAVDSGCDYIKMQRKDVRSFYTEEELRRPFRSPYGTTYGEYRSLFEFDLADLRRFDRKCRERGVPWFVTVQDEPSFDGLAEFDLPMYKIASSNFRKVPFLRRVARVAPPEAAVVLSTGGASLADIDAALTVFSDRRVHLLHCVAEYPCRPERARLGNLAALQRRFGSDRVTVGYSGHEEGFTVTLAAVDLGATMIERHFCVSRHRDIHLSLSHPGVWSPRRENGRGAGRGGLRFAGARWPGLGDLAAERVRMVQVGCGLPVTPSFFGIRART